MEYLDSHNYRTINTDELYLYKTRKIELPKKSVLITFDDGNYSVIKYALPILEKYNQKATVFMMGVTTRDITPKERHSSDSYMAIGKDILYSVQKTYPDLEFQSHTFNLHNRVNGEKPVKSFTEEELYDDIAMQYQDFGYTALAYPWGATSDNMIKALAREGHTKLAFVYGHDDYARKSDARFAVKRIKINGTGNFSDFKRWLQ